MLGSMLTTSNALTLFVFSCLFVLCCLAYLAITQNKAIADLEERLEGLLEQVGFDDLTGVYRRTAGERRMRLSLRSMPCIVGFIDVRDFGKVNKTLGWEAGDGMLVNLTESLANAFGREHDTIYRYGGDEFVLVLPAFSRATEVLPGDEPPPSVDAVGAVYDHAARILETLANGPVKFDWALEMASRPPDEPSQALHLAMEKVRQTKAARASLEQLHADFHPQQKATQEDG